jgi:serine phosphatase RsbU (regulator of sigma subunit)
MTAKNIPLVEIAQEVNKQLLAKLPTSLFLGAIFIEFNPDDYTLSIWNCGMSDMLIYRDSQLKQKIASSLFALGVIKQEFEPTLVLTVEKDDRIYSFSDGITEVINSENEEFGDARLEQTIIEMLSNKEDLEFLTRTVDGFRGNVGQFDDITLLELTC